MLVWLSVGRSSDLDDTLGHRIRVMGDPGWVCDCILCVVDSEDREFGVGEDDERLTIS